LTDADIRSAIERGDMDIEPFFDAHLTPNGYDLAIAEVMLPDTGSSFTEGTVEVPAMTRFMVSTMERVRLGPSMSAQLWLRTSWARRGVIASFGRIDAGFDGTLTFGALNSSASPLEVPIGETFAQLVVEPLSGTAEILYSQRSGHYQDQRGVTMAVPAGGGEEDMVELKAPCIERGCHQCCLETEMPLTRDDVTRLRDRGHDPVEFMVVEDGLVFLANREGRCYFLGADGRCTEYASRPRGCRLYPLILDEDLSNFVMDHLCPHGEAVREGEAHRRALLELLDRIAVERDSA
jgi:dCTP deaminase